MRITEKKFTRTRAMAVKAEILAAAARGDTELDFADVESAVAGEKPYARFAACATEDDGVDGALRRRRAFGRFH